MDIIYQLPEEIELSKHLTEKAIAYAKISLFGTKYYIPLDNNLKRLIKFQIQDGKIIMSYNQQIMLENFIRNTIDAAYLIIRDTIGSEIYSKLDDQIKSKLETMYSQFLSNTIESEIDKKTLKELPDVGQVE